jgi:hypothetical protein
MKVNKQKALAVARIGLTAVASMGVNQVIGNVIKGTTPALANLSTRDKIFIGVGRFVIASVLSDLASKQIVDTVDQYVTAFSVVEKEKKVKEKPATV